MASHVTEVEDVKEKQNRAMGVEVPQAHRLLEASAEIEPRRDVPCLRNVAIGDVLEGSMRGCDHDLTKTTTLCRGALLRSVDFLKLKTSSI